MHVPITSQSHIYTQIKFFNLFLFSLPSAIFNCVRSTTTTNLCTHTNRGIAQNTFFKPFSPLLYSLFDILLLLLLLCVSLARVSRCVHINAAYIFLLAKNNVGHLKMCFFLPFFHEKSQYHHIIIEAFRGGKKKK